MRSGKIKHKITQEKKLAVVTGILVIACLFLFMFRVLERRAPPRNPPPGLSTPTVYVSGGMFDLAETIYSIGIAGLLESGPYSAMDFTDVLCLSETQYKDLQDLCKWWAIPEYGIVQMIEKKGWNAYCPVRDGFPMGGIIKYIAEATLEDLLNPNETGDPVNDFHVRTNVEARMREQNQMNTSDPYMLGFIKNELNFALGISIGANDLYGMYTVCNCCIFNFNGLQGDSGALAELGQVAGRGYPISILKNQGTSDFGGPNNPMPTMAASSKSSVFLTLSEEVNSQSPVFFGWPAAIENLENKMRMLDNNRGNPAASVSTVMSKLPPLQQYWNRLGKDNYEMKHKSTIIPCDENGMVVPNLDYTDFWLQNAVYPQNDAERKKGWLNIAKRAAYNVAKIQSLKFVQDVVKFWA